MAAKRQVSPFDTPWSWVESGDSKRSGLIKPTEADIPQGTAGTTPPDPFTGGLAKSGINTLDAYGTGKLDPLISAIKNPSVTAIEKAAGIPELGMIATPASEAAAGAVGTAASEAAAGAAGTAASSSAMGAVPGGALVGAGIGALKGDDPKKIAAQLALQVGANAVLPGIGGVIAGIAAPTIMGALGFADGGEVPTNSLSDASIAEARRRRRVEDSTLQQTQREQPRIVNTPQTIFERAVRLLVGDGMVGKSKDELQGRSGKIDRASGYEQGTAGVPGQGKAPIQAAGVPSQTGSPAAAGGKTPGGGTPSPAQFGVSSQTALPGQGTPSPYYHELTAPTPAAPSQAGGKSPTGSGTVYKPTPFGVSRPSPSPIPASIGPSMDEGFWNADTGGA